MTGWFTRTNYARFKDPAPVTTPTLSQRFKGFFTRAAPTATAATQCPTSLKNAFDKCNHEELPVFSFDGIKCWSKCVEVYDGDTITVIFKYRDVIIKDRLRLWGINTPEIRTRDEEEKELGLIARDWLRERILYKPVWVEFLKTDKYGRSLAKIYTAPETRMINDVLVDEGMAEEYMR